MSQPTEIHTLAGAYALGALTEIERAGFARHVAHCEACAAEVAELSETAARLAAMVATPPPPRLRETVLAQVAQTRQVTAGRAGPGGRGEIALRLRRWTAAAVAAGVVAVAGMATVWAVQDARVDQAQHTAAQLRQDQAQVAAVLAAGDAVVRTTPMPGGGSLTVAVSPSRNDGVVLLTDAPAPPQGKTYQLWLINSSVPTSAGVLAAGQRSATVVLDSLGAADTLGVTVEPAGGSVVPSQPPFVNITLA